MYPGMTVEQRKLQRNILELYKRILIDISDVASEANPNSMLTLNLTDDGLAVIERYNGKETPKYFSIRRTVEYRSGVAFVHLLHDLLIAAKDKKGDGVVLRDYTKVNVFNKLRDCGDHYLNRRDINDLMKAFPKRFSIIKGDDEFTLGYDPMHNISISIDIGKSDWRNNYEG